MSSQKTGIIALMGSGELTSTMVEVHKDLLGRIGGTKRAVFLDTPAGFQLNADDLARRAVKYFRERVGYPMSVVSFKSKTALSPYEMENAYRMLREARFTLIGPGSPTYAVSQWRNTPIPEILAHQVEDGGCLVAASAAALTVGRCTLPVYEIYKVGEDLHWVEGLSLLDHFGFPLVVVPHWNNAEGGTHDTRFCYMGEPRFEQLELLLPPDVSILGLDEHTACILDLDAGEASVRGIGRVTLHRSGREITFEHGARFLLDVLRGQSHDFRPADRPSVTSAPARESEGVDGTFWRSVEASEAAFEQGMENGRTERLVSALLELDHIVWKGQQDLEDPEFISQARERFREMIVRMGSAMERSSIGGNTRLQLIEAMLRLRERYREEKRWRDADLLRQCLNEAGVVVEDTSGGARWKIEDADI